MKITTIRMLSLLFALVLYSDHAFASYGWLTFFEGSFKGKFIDAKTAQPIEGVVIVAAYQVRIMGPVEGGSETVDYKEDISNKKGEFHVLPHVFFYPSPFAFGGEKSHFIAYKAGYKFYESSKDDLDKDNTIKLEPIPSTYYPRYEALERAKGSYQYWVQWQQTKLLKKIVMAEENQLRQLERYPAGVIFKGFVGEQAYLIGPEDIAVDKNYIYIADRGPSSRIARLNLNGDWVSSFTAVSGMPFAFSLQKEGGVLWMTYDYVLAYTTTEEYDNEEDRQNSGFVMVAGGKIVKNPYNKRAVKEFIPIDHLLNLHTSHRFKIDKQNNFHFIAGGGLYLVNKKGNIIAKYIGHGYSAIALDSNDYSYVTSGSGITKFNNNIEPLKSMSAEWIGNQGFLNIAIDGNDIIYLSLKDSIHIYDKDFNFIKKIDLKNDSLGEIGITAITVDKDGSHLYLIDSRYDRVMAYDLISNGWVSKQRIASQ